MQAVTDLKHQADVNRRDQAFQEDIHLWKIQILKRTDQQATTVPDNSGHQEQSVVATQEMAMKTTSDPKPAACKAWIPKDITRHTERIDQQDSLWKMDLELQGKPITTPAPIKKRLKQALSSMLVDICSIGAVGFYQTLIKKDSMPFVTSLYKINQIIEEKKVKAIRKNTT